MVIAPFLYQWDSGATTQYITGLNIGSYNLVVAIDGCLGKGILNLVEPEELNLDVTCTNDDPYTQIGEGTGTVSVTGGIPPYHFLWNDLFNQTTMTAINLVAGKYVVEIMDNLGCFRSANVIVDSANRPEVIMFPTPAKEKVYFDLHLSNQEVQILYCECSWAILFEQQVLASNFDWVEYDISNLSVGLYHVNIFIGENKYYFKLEKL